MTVRCTNNARFYKTDQTTDSGDARFYKTVVTTDSGDARFHETVVTTDLGETHYKIINYVNDKACNSPLTQTHSED